jgi:hypothetical protein
MVCTNSFVQGALRIYRGGGRWDARLDPRRPAGLIWERLSGKAQTVAKRLGGHVPRRNAPLPSPAFWPTELPSKQRRTARAIPGDEARGLSPGPSKCRRGYARIWDL